MINVFFLEQQQKHAIENKHFIVQKTKDKSLNVFMW